jgi:dephospho-CoA kinase
LTRFIGLTGGIGAGKSEVLAAAARLGAETLSTDRVAHDVLDHEDVIAMLAERWGNDIVKDGAVDRDRVAEIVFEQPDELAWLESHIHPRVGEAVLEWRTEIDPSVPVAVIEVPLLFEASMETAFDETLAVIADDEIRERRLAERGQPGLEGREERQLPQSEKAARADRVIENNGSIEDLEREVAAALEAAGAEAAK